MSDPQGAADADNSLVQQQLPVHTKRSNGNGNGDDDTATCTDTTIITTIAKEQTNDVITSNNNIHNTSGTCSVVAAEGDAVAAPSGLKRSLPAQQEVQAQALPVVAETQTQTQTQTQAHIIDIQQVVDSKNKKPSQSSPIRELLDTAFLRSLTWDDIHLHHHTPSPDHTSTCTATAIGIGRLKHAPETNHDKRISTSTSTPPTTTTSLQAIGSFPIEEFKSKDLRTVCSTLKVKGVKNAQKHKMVRRLTECKLQKLGMLVMSDTNSNGYADADVDADVDGSVDIDLDADMNMHMNMNVDKNVNVNAPTHTRTSSLALGTKAVLPDCIIMEARQKKRARMNKISEIAKMVELQHRKYDLEWELQLQNITRALYWTLSFYNGTCSF